MNMLKGSKILLLMLVVTLSVAPSRVPAQQQPGTETVNLTGAGATFPAPLYAKWIREYNRHYPQVKISYDAIGSGDGIKLFMAGDIDFGGSDAAMRDSQIAEVKRGVQLIPATAGIIVLAYNIPGVGDGLRLPRDVYVAIFNGTIKKWNDPRIQTANPDLKLPKLDIVLVARLDSSGTTFAYTNHLSAISEDWRDSGPGVGKVIDWPGNTMVARGNGGVAGRIKHSEGSIGYVEYGYARRAGLPMAWLQNQAGEWVNPHPSSGRMALINTQKDMPENLRMFMPDPEGKSSYPIVTYSWLLLYKQYPAQAKARTLKHFISWALTTGQTYSENLGYIKLPMYIATLGTKAVEKIQ